MKLLVAFGTDDNENLNNDHVGMAKFFLVYEFSKDKAKFVEKRKNVQFKGNESIHGDPEKAKATSSVLEGVDVLVGKKFGPNILRLLGKFVCVVVRTIALDSSIEAVQNNIDRIADEKKKGDSRNPVVLHP